MQRGLSWWLESAEKEAIFRQTYEFAGARIVARAGELQECGIISPGRWAVVVDADETILDNAGFRKRLAAAGEAYSDTAWSVWVRERSATALPGSVAFVDSIRRAGGRVIVVTNRDEELCAPTRENIAALGMRVDAVLCKTGGKDDKNPRFSGLIEGTALPGLGALDVVGYVGDNIRDFPCRSQEKPGPWSEFGKSMFVLPNPMYGSWEKKPAGVESALLQCVEPAPLRCVEPRQP